MIDPPERALTLRQPWAWLVAAGWKTIENRPWLQHSVPERFLIHASRSEPRVEWERARRLTRAIVGIELPSPADVDRGGIVGIAAQTGTVFIPRALDVHELRRRQPLRDDLGPGSVPTMLEPFDGANPWHFHDQFGYELDREQLAHLPLVPCRGALGFWRVPDEVLRQVRKLEPVDHPWGSV